MSRLWPREFYHPLGFEAAPTGCIGRTCPRATIAVGIILILLFGGPPFSGEPDSELGAEREDMFTLQKPFID